MFLACKLKCWHFRQVSSLCEIFWSTVWTLWMVLKLIWFHQPKILAMEHFQPWQFNDINICIVYIGALAKVLFSEWKCIRWLLSSERSLSRCYSSKMDGVCTLNFSSQMLPLEFTLGNILYSIVQDFVNVWRVLMLNYCWKYKGINLV